MRLTMRPLGDDEDYWRIRELLRRALIANGLRERSWHVCRLDYWWWFGNPDLEHLAPSEHVFLWENRDGTLAAVLNPERRGEAFLQIDPALHEPGLEEAMVDVAEERLAITGPDGTRLRVYTDPTDAALTSVLAARGYAPVAGPGEAETAHRGDLTRPLPDVPVVPGYVVRPLHDGLEILERCYASGLAFHDDDIAVARANRDDPTWYRHIQSAPLYRRDLDIVAVAADGSVAAFCTAWFDDVTRTACLEPVATVPAHRRRGLASAVILEALHRLRAMGCRVVFVGGYTEAANALYASILGPDHDRSVPWERPPA